MKTYSIRLFPSEEQIQQLIKLSDIRMDVWNTLIDIQQKEYELNKKILSKFDLINLLPELKNTIKPQWKELNSKAIQTIAIEIYGSYQSFFSLIKKDPKARPPKLIENKGFHTINFNQSGWIIKKNIITINKIPLNYKSYLNISELNIKEIRVKYVNNKWLCDIVVNEEIVFNDKLNIDAKVLCIDLGLSKLGTGVDNKGNVIILNNRSRKITKYFRKQIGKIQNKISKKTKDSKKYIKLRKKVNVLYKKKNEQVKQTLHIQSKKLVNMNYKTIVVGDLSVKKLMEQDESKYTKTSRSFGESNINMFLQFLKYKSQTKQSDLIKIDERNTTQLNCLTGKLFKKKIELKDREVQLNDNVVIDRDLNSAINIMKRYYNNHLASMTEPLDYTSVINKFNLINKPTQLTGKPIVI
jgi:putative transposase